MRAIVSFLIAGLLVSGCNSSDTPDADPVEVRQEACAPINHDGESYVVCKFDLSTSDMRLFHSDVDGVPYRQFDTLAREMDEQGKTLVFAMNGGMYHENRAPVGFYRDTNGDQASVNLNDGPGNFHLKPNGVFWIEDSRAGVTESAAYIEAGLEPDYATQSGPLLVIDGALHPAFNAEGISQKRRNGVGVSEDGKTVYLAISDTAVTFHAFGTLFRDVLGVPNALFLDGQVSRLYAPGIGRTEVGLDMGPIVGVLE